MDTEELKRQLKESQDGAFYIKNVDMYLYTQQTEVLDKTTNTVTIKTLAPTHAFTSLMKNGQELYSGPEFTQFIDVIYDLCVVEKEERLIQGISTTIYMDLLFDETSDNLKNIGKRKLKSSKKDRTRGYAMRAVETVRHGPRAWHEWLCSYVLMSQLDGSIGKGNYFHTVLQNHNHDFNNNFTYTDK